MVLEYAAMTKDLFDAKGDKVWESFVKKQALSPLQEQQFRRYLELLVMWNKDINLTSIESVATIISHHFEDSLSIGSYVTFTAQDMVADIGSGGGFPGIPLKIKYPELPVVLIEVHQKKVAFLTTVIKELGLTGIEIYTLDWRTFLRKTTYPITYFVARASISLEEMVRLFSPGFAYKNATLIYWASQHWIMGVQEAPFFSKEVAYTIEHKKRRLVFFVREKG